MRIIKISGGLKNTTVDVSGLSSGMYNYKFISNQQYGARGKLVIAR